MTEQPKNEQEQPQADRPAGTTPSPDGTKPSASDRCPTHPEGSTQPEVSGGPSDAEPLDEIDEASDESFPASDPPSYTGGSATPSVPKNQQ